MRFSSIVPLVLIFAGSAYGQEFRGAFSGTVTDAQGAAIAKAKIIATETRTGTKSQGSSESSGAYTIPFLSPGLYEITAEAPGFKRAFRAGLTLNAGEHPVIDMRMEVGAVSESVTVTAEAPLVVESNASIGQTITAAEVEDFPVNGRTPMMLAHLAMGVISTFEPGPVRPFDNGAANSVTIGGAQSGTNEVLLNGSPNSGFSKQMAYSPSQDAVQEVRVNAFDADAAYGHSGGGTINLVVKSGTNSFHGAAHEFNQSSLLDANSFFVNKVGNPRPAYHYNQYGITASGPVWIPKIFNGKNHIFWLFSWEGLRDSDPANSPIETGSPVNFATVPTAAERQGDFSALLKANKPGTDYTIYDPRTGVTSGSQVARTPFPGNVIPANRLSPIALNYLKFYPEPNNSVTRADGFQNYFVTAIDSDGYDNELGQLDFVSTRNKLTFNARHNYRAQDKNNYFRNIGTGNFLYRINQGISFDDVYTLTPSTVMNVRASWTRFIENRGVPSDGFDLNSLGFPGYVAANSPGKKLPLVVFTSTSITAGSQSSFQSLGGDNAGGTQPYDSFQIFGDVIKIHGNHGIKIGTDIRQYRWSLYTQGYSSGMYTFNSSWTNGPLSNAAAAPLGQDMAAFLLGLPSSGNFDLNTQGTSQALYASVFVQDDWRARPGLTINMGLRFDHDFPTTERFNRAVNGFDATALNSATNPASAAFAAALASGAYSAGPLQQLSFKPTGGFTFPTAGNRNLYETNSYIFSPRFGFAWTPKFLDRKTVLRGGIAVFASPIEILGNGSSGTATLTQSGFSQTTSLTASANSFLTPSGTLADPFPNGFVQPSGSASGASTFLGQAITFYNPQTRDPYSLRWNFGVQRVLPGAMVLEVAYIGNHAVHLPINTQLDYVPRKYLSTSLLRDQTTINTLTAAVTNPFRGLIANGGTVNANTIATQQLLLPYPQFTGVTMNGNPAGSSIFHSLNARVQKRFTNGLTFLYNFTYSKNISMVNYLNPSDLSPERRVSNDNRPLRSVLAGSYELPIGRGRVAFHSRFANRMAGGWSFNGQLVLQSASQLGWGNYIYLGGPLNLTPHQPDGLAFDTTRFVTATASQLANNVQTLNTQFNNLRRDMVKNLDLSMIKKFVLGERQYLQLRFETFNTTNRVTFGNPNTTPTSSAFGAIATQANTPRRVQVGARLVW